MDNQTGGRRDMSACITLVLGLVCALSFGALLWHAKGPEAAGNFGIGYLLEMMLSLDNLFAFYLVFRYYKLSDTAAQNRALRWGIVGSVALRALMIGLCGAAVHVWRPLLIGCALVLIVSGVQLVVWGDADDDDDDLSDNHVIKLAKSITPVSAEYHGSAFFTDNTGNGCCGCEATPLLLVVVTIELSDIVFAMDSVPAIFGITEDPLIVWAACMCAVMCLRSLYSIVVNMVSEFEILSRAIGLVLLFIAGKMIADVGFGIDLPIWVTPVVVVGILGSGAVVSACSVCRGSSSVDHERKDVLKSLLDGDDDEEEEEAFIYG